MQHAIRFRRYISNVCSMAQPAGRHSKCHQSPKGTDLPVNAEACMSAISLIRPLMLGLGGFPSSWPLQTLNGHLVLTVG
ncbi:MAG: hypothetical protein IPJ27_23730 [Candidatus Accumulibacter sp.]|uniref:Uncharacterized protein n=1 Tax=Candidatus Accumulibacter proximus TaxID=2954385 RepID=A0A935Q3J0_9PROT|nr:hypothetical protein [Candidatus Accumulibacter proximus]